MDTKSNENKTIQYSANGKIISFNKALLMAIINLTPDSFYDGGKYDTIHGILKDIAEKIKQGADIIDIGAASSRPNATEITEEEEWKRLENILKAIRNEFPNIIISVDTYRASIAKKSADLGIDIINDISGGNFDSEMFKTVAKLNLPYILMHIRGKPKTMQIEPTYENVTNEIILEFEIKIKLLKKLKFNKLILDPGFGFGKNTTHNYQLLKHLKNFEELNFPILAGLSRKSMINKVIGTNPVTALNGTTVLNTIALLNGAKILRVHDVMEAKQAIKLVAFYEDIN